MKPGCLQGETGGDRDPGRWGERMEGEGGMEGGSPPHPTLTLHVVEGGGDFDFCINMYKVATGAIERFIHSVGQGHKAGSTTPTPR